MTYGQKCEVFWVIRVDKFDSLSEVQVSVWIIISKANK